MKWGATSILSLRKSAGMTQAQMARWLGVTVKQVKHLEHNRRSPSGPTSRLLDILAGQLGFQQAQPVQVLGASVAPADMPSSTRPESAPDLAGSSSKPTEQDADGAFVWQ